MCLGSGFVTLDPFHCAYIYLVHLCVFCVFLFHTAQLLHYCECSVVDLMGLKPNPLEQSSFSALTLLVRSYDP